MRKMIAHGVGVESEGVSDPQRAGWYAIVWPRGNWVQLLFEWGDDTHGVHYVEGVEEHVGIFPAAG